MDATNSHLTAEQAVLWAKLAAFDLDAASVTLPFSKRLQRETGWSRAFTLRAMAEYKKFVFLARVAGHEVTPSQEVDAVWHLHLIYTRSYWDEMCANILKRALHHGPTKGGAVEDQRFEAQYQRTLDSYQQFFGAPAPNDIWPEAAIRFAPVRMTMVDSSQHFIVPKAPFRFAARSLRALLFGGLGVLGIGGAAMAATGSKATEFFLLTGVGGVIIAIILATRKYSSDHKKKKDGSSCGSGCSSGLTSSDSGSSDGGSSGCSGGGGCGGGGD